jgi:hypothetical protein
MVDLRHTLPNLKALLLTLSSPIPPPQKRNVPTDSSANSRMTSRQISQAYSLPHSPGVGFTRENTAEVESPIKRVVRARRSRLSRGSVLGHENQSEGGSDDETEAGTETGTWTGTVDDTASIV